MTGRFQIKPTLFREATREDGAALTLIAQKTISACYRRFLGVDKIVELVESGAINQYIVANLKRHYCPVQLIEREPVGFAVCQENVIGMLMIDYRYHRRGLGTQLLAHCEAEMFQAYSALGLRCFEQNDVAKQFFHKHGWRETLTHHDKLIGARTIVYQKTWSDAKKKPATQQ